MVALVVVLGLLVTADDDDDDVAFEVVEGSGFSQDAQRVASFLFITQQLGHFT